MEILIVDGLSDDNTRDIVSSLAGTTDIPISLLDNPGRIVPKGLNIAFEHMQGDVFVRVDGHCEIAPDYVTQCVNYLREGDLGGVGGPIETISQTDVGKTIALAMSSKFGVGGSAFRTVREKKMLVDTIAFPAYTRAVLEQAGPFDEELVRNQDDEYNYRLRELGYKLCLTPDIKSIYYSRSTLHSLWRQYYQYGLYKVRVAQKHPRQMQIRQFVPVALVSVVLSGAVLAPFNKSLRFLWLLALGAYLTVNLASSSLTCLQHGWQHLRRLPLVFAILHFSYGFGFLHGLVKFYNRWGQH